MPVSWSPPVPLGQASSFVETTYTGIRAAVFLSRGVSSGRPTPTAQAISIIPHTQRLCQPPSLSWMSGASGGGVDKSVSDVV